MACVVDLLADPFRLSRDLDFDVLAYVDSGDSHVAHVLQGALDRFPLWVQDRLFGSNNNFGFHANKFFPTGFDAMLGKGAGGR